MKKLQTIKSYVAVLFLALTMFACAPGCTICGFAPGEYVSVTVNDRDPAKVLLADEQGCVYLKNTNSEQCGKVKAKPLIGSVRN